MKIKGKHIIWGIILFISFMGIFWIEKEPTLLGVISALGIIMVIASIIYYLIENYNQTLIEYIKK